MYGLIFGNYSVSLTRTPSACTDGFEEVYVNIRQNGICIYGDLYRTNDDMACIEAALQRVGIYTLDYLQNNFDLQETPRKGVYKIALPGLENDPDFFEQIDGTRFYRHFR